MRNYLNMFLLILATSMSPFSYPCPRCGARYKMVEALRGHTCVSTQIHNHPTQKLCLNLKRWLIMHWGFFFCFIVLLSRHDSYKCKKWSARSFRGKTEYSHCENKDWKHHESRRTSVQDCHVGGWLLLWNLWGKSRICAHRQLKRGFIIQMLHLWQEAEEQYQVWNIL